MTPNSKTRKRAVGSKMHYLWVYILYIQKNTLQRGALLYYKFILLSSKYYSHYFSFSGLILRDTEAEGVGCFSFVGCFLLISPLGGC